MNTGIVMINYKIASGWRMTFEVRARALLAGRNCRLHRCWGSQILAVPLSGWLEANFGLVRVSTPGLP